MRPMLGTRCASSITIVSALASAASTSSPAWSDDRKRTSAGSSPRRKRTRPNSEPMSDCRSVVFPAPRGPDMTTAFGGATDRTCAARSRRIISFSTVSFPTTENVAIFRRTTKDESWRHVMSLRAVTGGSVSLFRHRTRFVLTAASPFKSEAIGRGRPANHSRLPFAESRKSADTPLPFIQDATSSCETRKK